MNSVRGVCSKPTTVLLGAFGLVLCFAGSTAWAQSPLASVTLVEGSQPEPSSAQDAKLAAGPSAGEPATFSSVWGCDGFAASSEPWLTAEAQLMLKVNNQVVASQIFYANFWGAVYSVSAWVESSDEWRNVSCEIYVADLNGSTSAGDYGTIPPECGDERTTLIAEYGTYGVSWAPDCSVFTQNVPTSSHYSFSSWRSPNYSWAVLREYAVSNVYCVVSNHGSTPGLNSGYRSPSHNHSEGGATNSRHVYGDAADLSASQAAVWDSLRANAKSGACSIGCVEPRSATPSWFHVDYRGSCPAGW